MKTKLSLLLTIISLFVCSCKKTDVKITPPTGPNPPVLPTSLSPITTAIQGNVFNENGQPVFGVSISVGAKTTTTDSRGYFRIDNASLDKNVSLLTGHMDGYFKIVKTFAATSGTNYIRIKMIKRNMVGTINASAGGTVNLADGSTVTLPASAVVKKSDNSPYTGTINVYAVPIDPSAQDFPESTPGNLIGNDSTGKRIGLQSFGMLAVELESSAAEPLQIALGKTASLRFNIPSSLQSTAPASISLGYINDTTGVWQQQGSATKSGSSYTGTVSHFSFWNVFAPANAIGLSITVTDVNNKPLQYAIIALKSTDHGYWYGYTDSLGFVTCLVPFNEKLDYAVFSSWFCADNSSANPIGPFTQTTNVNIVVDTNTVATILSGTLTNCANRPAANGYVEIYHNYTKYIVPVDNSGDFHLSLPRCGSNDSISVLGVDTAGKKQSLIAYYALSSPSLNIGNVSACSQPIDVYVNVIYDDSAYSIIDSVDTYVLGGPNLSLDVDFECVQYKPNLNAISFNFADSGTTGPAQIHAIIFSKNGDAVAGSFPNINVNLTEYAHSIGEFYAGSFSGSYLDNDFNNPLTHTISCSFRVRRNH